MSNEEAGFDDAATLDAVWTAAPDPDWTMETDGSTGGSRFSLSNGFLGVAGTHTYVAGLFGAPADNPTVPQLVPAPDWTSLRLTGAGQTSAVTAGRLRLDLRRGCLVGFGTCHGIGFRSLTFVSMSDRRLGVQVVEFEPTAALPATTLQAALCEPGDLLVAELRTPSHAEPSNVMTWRTEGLGKFLAIADDVAFQAGGLTIAPERQDGSEASWTWHPAPKRRVTFIRIVAFARSADSAGDAREQAATSLRQAQEAGWQHLFAAHAAAWQRRWQHSDIALAGDPAAQRALRFALFHLNGAVNPTDEHVSIAARGLTGEEYRGHVFWDTEIYQLPFFTLTWPEAARSLLMYRFHTLPGARAKAAAMGHRGAMYAWESADTGAETTPDHIVTPAGQVLDVLCGRQEQHISADVAYAVWQYWLATGDDAFLLSAGAEMLLEIARFWASRATPGTDGAHHIRTVIGPDEYHEGVDDNAFTNVMAQWAIQRGIEVAGLLQQRWPDAWSRLSEQLALATDELQRWQSVAASITTGFNPHTGLFEQFAGYFGLQDLTAPSLPHGVTSVEDFLGKARLESSQLLKQADVVALLALLPATFPPGSADANFRYYEPRCCHGSSLSPAMHGLVAGRLGDRALTSRYFHRAAAIDLAETPARRDRGLHMATLGGLWMLTVFGVLGVTFSEHQVAVAATLPDGWRSLSVDLRWRGRRFRITADADRRIIEADLLEGEEMTLVIGQKFILGKARPVHAAIAAG